MVQVFFFLGDFSFFFRFPFHFPSLKSHVEIDSCSSVSKPAIVAEVLGYGLVESEAKHLVCLLSYLSIFSP